MAEAPAGGSVQAPRARSKGKGLGWSSTENLGLCVAESLVSLSNERSASMTAAAYGRRIQASFARSKPSDACTVFNTGCARDVRRWAGRSPQTCEKQFSKIKTACVLFDSFMRRLEGMNVTGGPTREDLIRCATFACNEKENRSATAAVMSQVYVVLRTPNHRIGRPYPFLECRERMKAENALVLDAGGDEMVGQSTSGPIADVTFEDDELSAHDVVDDTDDGIGAAAHIEAAGFSVTKHGDRARPQGTRSVKKAKRASQKCKESPKEDSDAIAIMQVAESSAKFSDIYEKTQQHKYHLASRDLALKERQLEFDKMKTLLSLQGSLSADQKSEIASRLFNSLRDCSAEKLPGDANADLPLDSQRGRKLSGLFRDDDNDDDVEKPIDSSSDV